MDKREPYRLNQPRVDYNGFMITSWHENKVFTVFILAVLYLVTVLESTSSKIKQECSTTWRTHFTYPLIIVFLSIKAFISKKNLKHSNKLSIALDSIIFLIFLLALIIDHNVYLNTRATHLVGSRILDFLTLAIILSQFLLNWIVSCLVLSGLYAYASIELYSMNKDDDSENDLLLTILRCILVFVFIVFQSYYAYTKNEKYFQLNKESYETNKSIFGSFPEGFAIIDQKKKVKFANPAFFSLLNYEGDIELTFNKIFKESDIYFLEPGNHLGSKGNEVTFCSTNSIIPRPNNIISKLLIAKSLNELQSLVWRNWDELVHYFQRLKEVSPVHEHYFGYQAEMRNEIGEKKRLEVKVLINTMFNEPMFTLLMRTMSMQGNGEISRVSSIRAIDPLLQTLKTSIREIISIVNSIRNNRNIDLPATRRVLSVISKRDYCWNARFRACSSSPKS